MDREDIIKLARKAGIANWHKDLKRWVFEPGLESFAVLVAAAAKAEENEACAKVCEHHQYEFVSGHSYAAAIRARGNI